MPTVPAPPAAPTSPRPPLHPLAPQLAEQTSELAQSTLVETHRQGQQLGKVGQHVEDIDRDVKEAGALLRFMRRCCCFQCCDCCDPTVEEDRRRAKRLEE